MQIRLACVEDGLDNIGFRKFAAYVKSIHRETKVAYVPTGNLRNLIRTLTEKNVGDLTEKDILKVTEFLAEGDIVGLCSMTQYSTTVYKIIAAIRRLKPSVCIVWGGIHAIIHPEDAIKHADAVCTGEGEFAFRTFLNLFKNGKDYTTAPSFWFRKDDNIIKFPYWVDKIDIDGHGDIEFDSMSLTGHCIALGEPLLYNHMEIMDLQSEGAESHLGLKVVCKRDHCNLLQDNAVKTPDNQVYMPKRSIDPETIFKRNPCFLQHDTVKRQLKDLK